MSNPKKVLYFAENALSAIQGGGIVACAVLKGLPAENLLGFYEYRNITPVPEYADRFVYLGRWRTPKICQLLNKATNKLTTAFLYGLFTEPYIRKDLALSKSRLNAVASSRRSCTLPACRIGICDSPFLRRSGMTCRWSSCTWTTG